MVSLGDSFPVAARKEAIERHLVPGAVIRIPVRFPDQTKPKFLILVADDEPDVWSFIINSEINSFVLGKPHLLQCQVKVDSKSHPFLSYDSHAACEKVLRLRRDEVIRDLLSDASGTSGHISQDVKEQICAAVKFAKTLSPDEKKRILACLS